METRARLLDAINQYNTRTAPSIQGELIEALEAAKDELEELLITLSREPEDSAAWCNVNAALARAKEQKQ